MNLFGQAVEPVNLKIKAQSLLSQIGELVPSAADIKIIPVTGLTATSWKITVQQRHWLMKHSTASKQRLGVNFRKEYRILKSFSLVDLAPKPWLRVDDWLLCEWIAGSNLQQKNLLEPHNQQQLITLLHQIHRQPLTGYSLDIKRLLATYWQDIDRKRLSSRWLRWQHWAMNVSLPSGIKRIVAHMDLHAGNIIQTTQGLRLIDWEYAADTDIAVELAAFLSATGWEYKHQQQFLSHYCLQYGHLEPQHLSRTVSEWRPWIYYLAMMWYEVRWAQTRELQYLEYSQQCWQALLT